MMPLKTRRSSTRGTPRMAGKLDLLATALVTGVCRAKPYTVEVPRVLDPFRFLLLTVSGWMNQHQLQVIEYLREENRVLREQLGERRLRFNDNQRRRLAVKAKGWEAGFWRRSPRSSRPRRCWLGIES